jgi:hypothetical protein
LNCAIPTLCFSEKTPPVAALFAIFKCSMQHLNKTWIVYIYTPDSRVGVVSDFWTETPWSWYWVQDYFWLVLKIYPILKVEYNWYKAGITSYQSWYQVKTYITDQHWYIPPKTSLLTTNMTFWAASPEWSFATKIWGLWCQT